MSKTRWKKNLKIDPPEPLFGPQNRQNRNPQLPKTAQKSETAWFLRGRFSDVFLDAGVKNSSFVMCFWISGRQSTTNTPQNCYFWRWRPKTHQKFDPTAKTHEKFEPTAKNTLESSWARAGVARAAQGGSEFLAVAEISGTQPEPKSGQGQKLSSAETK